MLRKLGITLPIIQAPMAGTSTPALAAAVSNAGGLGSIAISSVDVPGARVSIQKTRELVRDKPFNVNIFVNPPPVQRDAAVDAAWLEFLRPEYERVGKPLPTGLVDAQITLGANTLGGSQLGAGADSVLDLLVQERPPIVSFHFGLPPPSAIAALKDAGVILLATATSLAEGRAVQDAGIDAVVAQGIEAGGHRGIFDPSAPDDELPTASLVRLLVKSLTIPVIAAGGIMDGAGIAAALDLGATAAQLGTAFVACPESAAPPAYRALLASDGAHHTRMVPIVSGRPARSLPTRWTELFTTQTPPKLPTYPLPYSAAKALNAAANAKGDTSYGAFWAGMGAPLARAMPADELVSTLERELKETRAAKL